MTTLVLAGAFIAGCQESDLRQVTAHRGGVSGDKTYAGEVHGDPKFRDRAVYGDSKYSANVQRTDVDVKPRDGATRTDVTTRTERTDLDRPNATDVARTASVRTETVTNTPTTPAEVRTSADVRAPADVRADIQNTPTDVRAGVRGPGAAGDVTVASGKADPERAAFASTAHFPNDMRATDDLRATAMISRDGVKIANATDREIKDAKVWVDGRYVSQVNSIPAHSVVTVKSSEFSDKNGNLPTDTNAVKQVQLQTRDNLYNLQGPVFENR
jgi:hypothetical protein